MPKLSKQALENIRKAARNRKPHTDPNCMCIGCRHKRGERLKHKQNCMCASCLSKRGELKHKPNCKCVACLGKRGESYWKGKKRIHSSETIDKISKAHNKPLGKKSMFWQHGQFIREYPREFTGRLKQKVIERHGSVCVICKISNEQHKQKYNKTLLCHHIDFNRENNSYLNFVPICCVCHPKVHAYDVEIWKAILRFIACHPKQK